MNLAGRLVLMAVILDIFLFFGMAAVGYSTVGLGNYGGKFVNMSCNSTDPASNCYNESYGQSMVNLNASGAIVPAETGSWASASYILNSVIGFIQLVFGVATAPFTFMALINAPSFAVVLVGAAYIVLGIIAVVQLISGRSA